MGISEAKVCLAILMPSARELNEPLIAPRPYITSDIKPRANTGDTMLPIGSARKRATVEPADTA